ncbi:MAG TPA: Amuc_1100 family pilus-like protein [Chthoniobacter sp.]|nr:Amuc_1100 family pilus-like protein [Chthoniobacter sp.]
MNWVQENKFLTGFIAVMVVGVGALGFEVYSASSRYDEALENYTKASGEYNRLRHLVPYPSRANLDQLDQQKQEAGKVVTDFEEQLSQKEFPLAALTPTGFQDQLKNAVNAVRKASQEGGVQLPEKFYLSFEKYETVPPTPEAATPLGRELKAVEWVVNQILLQPPTRIEKITGIARAELPEEHGKGGKNALPQGGPGGGPGGQKPPGGGGGGGRRDLVKYHSFAVNIQCKQEGLLAILKALAAPSTPQFFVVRKVAVRNEKPKGPLKVDPNAPAADPKDTGPKIIVGEEKIEAIISIDMVDFTAPNEKSASEQPSPKTSQPRKP